MNRINTLILIAITAFASGCAMVQPHYNEQELNSDLQYNAADRHWYHSTAPPKAREMMSFDSPHND